jgi:hypothetical protein
MAVSRAIGSFRQVKFALVQVLEKERLCLRYRNLDGAEKPTLIVN